MSGSSPIEMVAGVVAAFVSNNSVPIGELPALIQAVHTSVKRLAEGPESTAPQVEVKALAVPIRKSVTPEYLICLEDGKQFKSLRRNRGKFPGKCQSASKSDPRSASKIDPPCEGRGR